MNPEYLKKIEKIFHQALEKSEEERQSFVEAQCKGDTVLLDELNTLLKTTHSDDSIGEIIQNNAKQLKELNDPWVGQTIDQYEITEEIAIGGMGAVYIGKRTDSEYHQQVAIKLMSHGLISKQARQRFLSERQILANLNHPNIAKLLDGGTTDSGVPYLVMEFIEGEPIDKYCDNKKLTIKQRIQLMLKVCSAIQYAHQNLVIHRDIKTSNILVTKEGVPKLLDFGIAKLLDQQSMEHTVALTRTEMRLLTPEYASPEQIRGEAISTATDVYGVGILLFKLLTGYFPFMVSSYSPAELEQFICKQPPPKPSGVISKYKDKQIANNRKTHWQKLQNNIKGDLDNIILLALSKEKSRRYNTIESMAEDLRNFLNLLPISAQAPSFKYRLNKFIRRNSLAVIVTTGIFVAVAGLVSFYTWQLSEQRDIAIAAEIKAQQKAENLRETTDFIISLFTTANPRSKGTQFITARDLLDESMKRINQDLKTDTVSKAQLLYNLGLAYNALNEPDIAVSAQRQALSIHRHLLGDESLEISEIMNRLGDALRQSGKNDEGYEYLKKALEMRIQITGKETNEIADSYNNLAMALRNMGRHDEALKMQHKSVAMHQRVSDPIKQTIHTPLNNLALLYRDERNFIQSIHYAKLALEEFYKRGKQTDLSTYFSIKMNLTNSYLKMGKYKLAKDSILEGIEVAKRKYKKNNSQIILANRVYAQTEHKMGNLDLADKLFEENITACKVYCKKRPILIAITQKYWALLKLEKGEIDKAQELIITSLKGYEKYSSLASGSATITQFYQAEIALAARNYQLYHQTINNLDLQFKKKAPTAFQHNYINMVKANYFLQQKDYAKAEQLINGVSDFFLNETGDKSPNYLKAASLQTKIYKQGH